LQLSIKVTSVDELALAPSCGLVPPLLPLWKWILTVFGLAEDFQGFVEAEHVPHPVNWMLAARDHTSVAMSCTRGRKFGLSPLYPGEFPQKQTGTVPLGQSLDAVPPP
jgi:hypothetical protein